jgi:hypothetical protein
MVTVTVGDAGKVRVAFQQRRRGRWTTARRATAARRTRRVRRRLATGTWRVRAESGRACSRWVTVRVR